MLVARLVPNSQVYTYLWWYDVACNRAELIKAQEPEKKSCQETNAQRTSGYWMFHVKLFLFALALSLAFVPFLTHPLTLSLSLYVLRTFSPLLSWPSPSLSTVSSSSSSVVVVVVVVFIPFFIIYPVQTKQKYQGNGHRLYSKRFFYAFCACPSMVHNFKSWTH